jgi:hypothetical protein
LSINCGFYFKKIILYICSLLRISFLDVHGVHRYLVEKLSTRDIGAEYNSNSQEMTYMMSTAIGKKFESDRCPEGFVHDEHHLHCRGSV